MVPCPSDLHFKALTAILQWISVLTDLEISSCLSFQAFNSILEVANFPLKERSKAALKKLAVVTARRKVEMREMEVSHKGWLVGGDG